MLQYLEPDLVLMSVVIFLPSLFALLLLVVPRGRDEVMRWLTLFGTALTLVASLWLLIDYVKLVDTNLNQPQAKSSLAARADEDYKARNTAAHNSPVPQGEDLVGRY